MRSLTPFLWFDTQAEAAMKFYTSVFKDSKELGVTSYSEAGPGPAGTVMTATFELNGLQFTALNGGPLFKFTEAVSFVVDCDTQDEIDYYWDKLSEGGEPGQCGWLKDQFGLSWQVVPGKLTELMSGPDSAGVQRATAAMLKMTKLDINVLQAAYDGK